LFKLDVRHSVSTEHQWFRDDGARQAEFDQPAFLLHID
jgi:hypothetical protein